MVTVEAASGADEREKTATQTITVTVTDVSGEAPGKPAAPAVAAASVTSLTVSWLAPDNAGPAITDYDYRHRTTSPEGTWTEVTDTAIMTLSATIGSLAENTSYDVQVRATNDEGTGAWSDSGTDSTDANAAPSFDSSATFSAAENQTTAGTVEASDGDAGDDITGYAITGGADQALFEIGATDGALTFKTAPNFEAPSDTDTNGSYVVTVEAASGADEREKTATQTITVTVTDVSGEAPGKPAAPAVAAASVTSLTVSWLAPDNAGPAITDYDYRHRTSPDGSWTEVTDTAITALSATIGSLAENTSYDVQVRATNDEGTGAWSDSGTDSTDANAAPSFDSSATFSAAENQTTAGTVEASDDDSGDDITGYAITGGADQGFFSIGATDGALTFDAAPNYEDAKDIESIDPANTAGNNQYVVVVTATSGAGEREKTATQTITVTVTDVAGEAPGKPAAPAVSAASVSSLNVSWTAPANAGPAITDYDYRHRTSPDGSWTEVTDTEITALSATIAGLAEGTSYDVQVRATNDEGTGAWSDSGTDSTDANAAPSFDSSATFSAAENQTTAGTVEASDGDAGDDITGYAITGGADQALFEIGATDGALTFKTAPNFEAPSDTDTNGSYVVTVEAASGADEREKTATQTITVTVTDVSGEAPGKPAAPAVAAASVTSLTVSWLAPDNAGPAITDYDYRHRTSPDGSWTEVTDTAITALSATIGSLAENTSYDVQVRATNDEGTGAWSDSGTDSTDANAAPSFDSSATFSAAENQTTAGTVEASDGDAGDDITGYAITGGADQALFEIGATDGALTFKTAPNFEAPSDTDTNGSYVVTVEAASGADEREKTATQTITVTVTDVSGEAPGKPAAPAVAAASVTSLTVSWLAPDNAGPAITDYDYRHRTSPDGSWTEVTDTAITALSATIGSLAENTSYDVQVRATNDEGTGAWSDSGTDSTDANAAPSFDSSATFSAAENQTTAGTVEASDGDAGDDITGYAITGGADQALFEIGATDGALTFKTAPNFEAPSDTDTNGSYVVTVEAASGADEREKTATQTITVTVTDVSGEAPGKPAAPAVAAASVTSLTVSWLAPDNAGPAITDYDYRHRTSPDGSWTEVTDTAITALSATIGSLAENTSYDVQVRATNDEGTGAWSDSGTDSTDANAAPSFDSSATFSAAENQTTAGTVVAADSDTDDDITGYAITGGADQALFEIGATDGALTFETAPNFEDAKDQDTNNTYVVTVEATSGTDTREKTATQTITVTVTNADEGRSGTVAIDDTAPTVGDELTASTANPADPDGLPDPFAPTWKWYRTPDGGSETEISGETSATYTVVAADLGATLTAKASWTDKGGFANTLSSAPTSAVAAASALPTLSVADAAGTEGGAVTFTVALSPAAAAEVTVDYATSVESDDTATSGTDFTAVAATTLTFAVGDTEKTFTVATTEDTTAEEDETFTVTLSNVSSNAQLAADPTARGTIVDDDLPTLGFSEDSIFIVEERGEIEFKVKLSAASTVPIAVDWETEAGSAEADVDYTEASGTLTFAPGDTEETITVDLIDDEILEQLETFTVRLSGTDDALVTLGTSSSIGGIIDRDAATITFAEETTVEEDAGTVTLTLTASGPSTTAYTIDYDTEDGTAVAGTDYTAASGTVRFRALQTERTITITVLEDTVEEEPEYFTVRLDDPSHRLVDLASGPPPRVRIVDEIAPAPEDLEAEPVEGSYTSLAVSWDAPRIPDGGPALTGYEVRYRERPNGDWVEAPHAGTARTATLTGLEVDTVYEVEVRALYGEMQSVWVRVPGQVRTATPPPASIRNVSIVNGPGSDGWSAGERVEVEVVYPVPMVVEKPEDCWSYNADGTCRESGPFVLVVFSDDARPGYGKSLSTPLAPYESGSGTATLRFAYTVGEDEDGALRVSVADNGILLRGATIRTLEGGEGKPEYTNTRVAQVTVERSGRAWTAGEKVRVQVRFSGPAQYTPPDDPENRDEVVVDETGGRPDDRSEAGRPGEPRANAHGVVRERFGVGHAGIRV